MASFSGHCIVIDHGVHVAGGDQKAKARLTVLLHARRVPPVGLADQRNAVAARLKKAADDGRPKARVVHVGVAADVDKVRL